MPIKPSPTIAGKLRKLFSNNKQTIEPAIGDSIPGGSGGGNVLTLYFEETDGALRAYKNLELTEEYATREEAATAIEKADIIKLVPIDEDAPYSITYYPILKVVRNDSVYVEYCTGMAEEPSVEVILWHSDSIDVL